MRSSVDALSKEKSITGEKLGKNKLFEVLEICPKGMRQMKKNARKSTKTADNRDYMTFEPQPTPSLTPSS